MSIPRPEPSSAAMAALFVLLACTGGSAVATLATATVISGYGAYCYQWARYEATRTLPAPEAARVQALVRLALFTGLVVTSVCGDAVWRASCAVLCALACRHRCTADPWFWMAVSGLVLTTTGHALRVQLQEQHGLAESTAEKWTTLVLPAAYAAPAHWWGFVHTGIRRETGAERGEATPATIGLVVAILVAMVADEFADATKRTVVHHEQLGRDGYLAASAASLLCGYVGESVGGGWTLRNAWVVHTMVQWARMQALGGTVLSWPVVGMVIAAEDVSGALVVGALNREQELAQRHGTGSNKSLAWVDAAERVGKAVLRVGTLGAVGHFGRAAVGQWGMGLSLASTAGVLLVASASEERKKR